MALFPATGGVLWFAVVMLQAWEIALVIALGLAGLVLAFPLESRFRRWVGRWIGGSWLRAAGLVALVPAAALGLAYNLAVRGSQWHQAAPLVTLVGAGVTVGGCLFLAWQLGPTFPDTRRKDWEPVTDTRWEPILLGWGGVPASALLVAAALISAFFLINP